MAWGVFLEKEWYKMPLHLIWTNFKLGSLLLQMKKYMSQRQS